MITSTPVVVTEGSYLTEEEAALFYKLTFSIHYWVNMKYNVIRNVNSIEEYIQLPFTQKNIIRSLLYKTANNQTTSQLLDEYIEENPSDFTADELAIVSGWKLFYDSEFYLVSGTDLGSVLVQADTVNNSHPQVFLVKGITQSMDEVFSSRFKLPIKCNTVLLQFRGKLIYDGMATNYKEVRDEQLKKRLIDVVKSAAESLSIQTVLTQSHLTEKNYGDTSSILMNDSVDELLRRCNTNAGFLYYLTTWRPNAMFGYEGERCTMQGYIPWDSSAPCICGLSEGLTFAQCCQRGDIVNIVCPSPPLSPTSLNRYCTIEWQTIKFDVTDGRELRRRFAECTVLTNIVDDLLKGGKCMWIYHGALQLSMDPLGKVNFGDIDLHQDNTLEVSVMSHHRATVILTFLYDVARDLLRNPRKTVSNKILRVYKAPTPDKPKLGASDFTTSLVELEKFNNNADQQSTPNQTHNEQTTDIKICAACSQSKANMQRCSGCRSVNYCNRECQLKDWPKHKLECKLLARK